MMACAYVQVVLWFGHALHDGFAVVQQLALLVLLLFCMRVSDVYVLTVLIVLRAVRFRWENVLLRLLLLCAATLAGLCVTDE